MKSSSNKKEECYEWLVISFFIKYTQHIYEDEESSTKLFIGKAIFVYFDEILIKNATKENRIIHLRSILRVLEQMSYV